MAEVRVSATFALTHLERAHAEGYVWFPQAGESVETVDAAVWAYLPWDEE